MRATGQHAQIWIQYQRLLDNIWGIFNVRAQNKLFRCFNSRFNQGSRLTYISINRTMTRVPQFAHRVQVQIDNDDFPARIQEQLMHDSSHWAETDEDAALRLDLLALDRNRRRVLWSFCRDRPASPTVHVRVRSN